MNNETTDESDRADDADSLAEPKESHPDSVARFYEQIHQRGAEDPLRYHTEQVREHAGHLADHVVPLAHGPPQIGVYREDMRFYRDLLGALRLEGYWVAEVEVIGNFLRLTVQPDDHRTDHAPGSTPPDARSPGDLSTGGDD